MIKNIVAARYSEALFNVAKEKGKLEEFKQELKLIVDTIWDNEKLKLLLFHPKVDIDDKKQILKEVFKHHVSAEIMNFVFVVMDYKRLIYIKKIYKQYKTLVNREREILPVEVITAVELDQTLQHKLKSVLEYKFEKEIVIKNKLSKTILGGLIVKAKDTMIDASLSTKLNVIRKNTLKSLGV